MRDRGEGEAGECGGGLVGAHEPLTITEDNCGFPVDLPASRSLPWRVGRVADPS